MKLSVKSHYAARAVLGLARHFEGGKAVRVEKLAEAEGMPAGYLVQILLELKSGKILRSVRGKEGGYLLARPPSEISLGDILRCIHGQVFDSQGTTDTDTPLELCQAWKKLQRALEETADRITFHELLEAGVEKQRMYYI